MKCVLLIGMLGAVAIATGVIAVVVGMSSPASAPQITAPQISTSSTTQPGASAAVAVTTSGNRPQVDKHLTTAKLRQELASATDLRMFAMEAMRRPAEGGYLYATRVLFQCGALPKQLEQQITQWAIDEQVKLYGTVSPRILAAQNRMRQQCASFAEGETTAMILQIEALVKSSGAGAAAGSAIASGGAAQQGADPLLSALRIAGSAHIRYQQLSPTDPEREKKAEAFMSALTDALEYKDTMLYPSGLMMRLTTFNPDKSAWFEGTRFTMDSSTPLNIAYLRAMLEIAECSLGPGCMLDNQMMSFCATGTCYDDRVAFSRYLFVEHKFGTAEKFNQALKYLPRIEAALQRGDVKAFLPPK